MMIYSPQTIVLLDALTGQVRASVSSNLTVTHTHYLPNLIVTGSSSTFGEIYVQSKNSNLNLTIAKFTENIPTSSLQLVWE